MESAINSRESRENFMPSWFMLMPSDTERVENSRGVPPASAIPALAAATWKSWVMLQGVCSPFMLTTPIIGVAIASSSSPVARMKARCGARSSPSVVMRERSLGMGVSRNRSGSWVTLPWRGRVGEHRASRVFGGVGWHRQSPSATPHPTPDRAALRALQSDPPPQGEGEEAVLRTLLDRGDDGRVLEL